MMTSKIVITIKSKKVRKIVKDTPQHDPELDQVVDRAATRKFERAIHSAIATAVEQFLERNGVLDERVIGALDFDYDTETLVSDDLNPRLEELGNIEIKAVHIQPK